MDNPAASDVESTVGSPYQAQVVSGALVESVEEVPRRLSAVRRPEELPLEVALPKNHNGWLSHVTNMMWSRLVELLFDPMREIPGLRQDHSLCFILFGWDKLALQYDLQHKFDNHPDTFFPPALKEKARAMREQLRTAPGALKIKSF